MFSVQATFPIVIATLLLFALATSVLFDLSKDRSARYWVYASIGLPIGLVLVLLRGVIPDWISYALSNFLTFYSWCLFYVSLEFLILKKSRAMFWTFGIAIIYTFSFTAFAQSGNLFYSSLMTSLTWGISNLVFAYNINRYQKNSKNLFLNVMVVLYLLTAFTWLSRVFLANYVVLPLMHDSSFFNWVTMVLNLILVIARQINYLAIRYNFTEIEKENNERLLAEREVLIGELLRVNKTATSGALSASIAHELNQPLGATQLNLQFLKKKIQNRELTPEVELKVVEALDLDNQRAARIVRSLKSIFVNDAQEVEEINIANLVSDVLEIAKSEIRNQSIQVKLELSEGMMVRASSIELQQVLLNLLNNAVQALQSQEKSNRVILIKGEKNQSKVILSVEDNGPGVSKNFQPNLFELLSTTKEKGMGLGLWLCKHIINRIEGNIFYEAVENRGARFVIEIPVAV